MDIKLDKITEVIKNEPDLMKGLSDLKAIIEQAMSDTNEFLKGQAIKTARYISELNDGIITKQQFDMNMRNIARLVELQEINMEIASKATAQRLRNAITGFALKTLLSKLPF